MSGYSLPAGDRPIRVAFLYQVPESWGNVRSIWDAMQADPAFAPEIILLPFYHQDYSWNQQATAGYLEVQGLPYRVWNSFDIAQAGFDIAIFTSPYDSTRPAEYHIQAIAKLLPCTVYIPYGLETGGGDVNMEYQYGQPTAVLATRVYVRSEGAKEMYRRYCPRGDGHVVVSGHPRMDGMYGLERFAVDPQLLAAIGERQAILWNAHFSFDLHAWSTFDLFAEAIFTAFETRPELALIFRPHPLLWKKLINLGIFDEQGVARLKQDLRERGVIVDERPDHRHVFAASAAMLSDSGSFFLEYLATGKPVLYLDNPRGLGLNEEGEKVARLYRSARSGAQIERFLDQCIQGIDYFRAARAAALDDFLHGYDGRAGQRVADDLKQGFGR